MDRVDDTLSMALAMFSGKDCPFCNETMECMTGDGVRNIYWCHSCQIGNEGDLFYDIDGLPYSPDSGI